MSPTTSSEASISFWAPSLSTFNQVSQDDKEIFTWVFWRSHLGKALHNVAGLVLLVVGEEAGHHHHHHKSNSDVEVSGRAASLTLISQVLLIVFLVFLKAHRKTVRFGLKRTLRCVIWVKS